MVADGQAASDLAARASRAALESCRLAPSDLDLIVVATFTPDMPLPSCAALVQRELGVPGIPVFDLNAVGPLKLYVDGADECDPWNRLIKGGGAALTREKIIAAASERFVCIIDEAKQVDLLGRFPLPVEVIPMARSHVARAIVAMGGQPVWREGVVTDNGNWILDVHNWRIQDPVALEAKLNQIVGVVANGLFAARAADEVVINGQIRPLRTPA